MALVAGRRGAKEEEGYGARKDRGRGAGKRFLRCVTPVDVMKGRMSGNEGRMGGGRRGIYGCVSRGRWGRKSKSNYGVITQRELTVRNTHTIPVIYSFTHDSDTHEPRE